MEIICSKRETDKNGVLLIIFYFSLPKKMKKKELFFPYYSFLSSILTYSFISIYLYWLWAVCRRRSLFLLFLWLIFLLSNSIFLSFSVTPLETKTLSTIYLKIIYLNIVEDALFIWNIILCVFRVYIHDRPSYVNVRFVTWFFN